jgi:hypothetical protein
VSENEGRVRGNGRCLRSFNGNGIFVYLSSLRKWDLRESMRRKMVRECEDLEMGDNFGIVFEV